MKKQAQNPVDPTAAIGRSLISLFGTGLAGGVGATALYHALDQAKRKKKILSEEQAAISAGAPIVAEEPANLDVKIAGTATDTLLGGLLGAGAGGLYGGVSSMLDDGVKDKKQRLRNALRSAATGAAGGGIVGAGAGFNRHALETLVGGAVPTTFYGGLPSVGGGEKFEPVTPQQKAWVQVLGTGALGAGIYGGNKLVNGVMDKKKHLENTEEVDNARKEYLAALRGDDVKAAQALDTAYENYRTKKATNWSDVHDLSGFGRYLTDAGGLRGDVATAMLLSAVGGGLVGGHYMYGKTVDSSKARNLQSALQSRARMQGLPTMWVDPDELAQTKQLALAKNKVPRLEHDPSVSAHG